MLTGAYSGWGKPQGFYESEQDISILMEVNAGTPPGTLPSSGDASPQPPLIQVMTYNAHELQEHTLASTADVQSFLQESMVTWINITGNRHILTLEQLGTVFKVHPLVLEDIAHTGQRPKLEDYGDYLFLIAKLLRLNDLDQQVDAEQISMILGPHYVITVQEYDGDVFTLLRERLRTGRGRIRSMSADYLLYALLDTIVDDYFLILEDIGERIETIEDALVTDPSPTILTKLHALKRDMIFLRKSVWPLREVISRLERWESPLIQSGLALYLRDIYDHTIQVIDAIETNRDLLSGMLDIYLSSASNRMNEVMKVLTIIATIFIPLTLVVGIYGMNFTFMPELQHPWGYPMVYLIMAVISGIMLIYFRRRRWL
jgi:magnesium transporter